MHPLPTLSSSVPAAARGAAAKAAPRLPLPVAPAPEDGGRDLWRQPGLEDEGPRPVPVAADGAEESALRLVALAPEAANNDNRFSGAFGVAAGAPASIWLMAQILGQRIGDPGGTAADLEAASAYRRAATESSGAAGQPARLDLTV